MLQANYVLSSGTVAAAGGKTTEKFADLKQLLGGQSTAGVGAEFPPPDEVFRLDAVALDDRTVQVRFAIREDFYLYRKRMKFAIEGSASDLADTIVLPEGKLKSDPYFGDMQVYYRGVDVQIPIAGESTESVTLRVGYQGCAEAGLCYPPQTKLLKVTLPAAGSSGQGGAISGSLPTVDVQGQLSETDQLASNLVHGSLVFMLASFFGYGLLLAFTPCVLPMVPILATIIAGQGERVGGTRGFSLAVVYVLAMALTYTGAGISAAVLGQNLQALFQHPVVLVLFSGVFIALALAMFGFYELQMPSSWQTRLQTLSQASSGGRYGGVAVMGALSALIVGPCVAAPLAAALIVIGGSGDPVRGGLALFFLSLGMGVPLLAVGAFGDRVMPKMGAWMNQVKQLFGLMLLAVAIYLLSRILADSISMGLWSGLLILTAVVFTRGSSVGPGHIAILRLRQGLGALALVYASVLAVGATSGASDPLDPLAMVLGDGQHRLKFIRVSNLQELDRLLSEAKHNGQPVMLDFYADWCISCKQLESETFTKPGVQVALKNTVLLQADVTAYGDEDKALLARYQLQGPPAILFFNLSGEEVRARRVIGFMDEVDFRRTVGQALKS